MNSLGRDGVWQEERVALFIEVPNQEVDNPFKEIYVEIGFFGELEDGGFAVYPDPPGGIVELLAPHENTRHSSSVR